MSNKINIFVRQDLKMRKGKMAAQSAHTAQKLLIEAMPPQNGKRYLCAPPYREFMDWMKTKPVGINMVKDEVALRACIDVDRPFAIIIDSGRTEFKGVPTLTCASQGLFSSAAFNELHIPASYGQDIRAKQLYVFSKQNPLSKERACELAVTGCLVFHESMMEKFKTPDGAGAGSLDVSEETEFGMWVSGAFAKIALGVPTDQELFALRDTLQNNGIRSIVEVIGENACLVIEPKIPANIDPLTRHLTLI